MGPTWVLSAPDGPHIGPMNLAIRELTILHGMVQSRGIVSSSSAHPGLSSYLRALCNTVTFNSGQRGTRCGAGNSLERTVDIRDHWKCMMTSSNGNIYRYWPFYAVNFPSQRPVTRSFDVFSDLRLE